MPKLTVRQVLAQNELTMDQLECMDYKDVAAHHSAALEAEGYNCPDGYNCPRSFIEWLDKQRALEDAGKLTKDQEIDLAWEEKHFNSTVDRWIAQGLA